MCLHVQSIDFFGALRARVYDDAVRTFLESTGFDNMGSRLVNNREKVDFPIPSMDLVRLRSRARQLQNARFVQNLFRTLLERERSARLLLYAGLLRYAAREHVLCRGRWVSQQAALGDEFQLLVAELSSAE